MELARNIVQAFPKIFKRLDEQEKKVSHEQQDTDYDFCEDNQEMLMDEENSYVLLGFLSHQNVKRNKESASVLLESHTTGPIMEVLFSELSEHKALQTAISSTILPGDQENVVNAKQNNAIVARPLTLCHEYSVPDSRESETFLGDPTIRSKESAEENASDANLSNVALNNLVLEALETINTIPIVGTSFSNQERILDARVITSAETPLVTARGPVSVLGSSEVLIPPSQAGVSNFAVQQNMGNIPRQSSAELNSSFVARPSPLNSSSTVSAPLIFSQETVQSHRQVVFSIVPPVVSPAASVVIKPISGLSRAEIKRIRMGEI